MRGERLALIERASPELSLALQAELLSLSRSSLYYKAAPPTAEEIAVKHRIDEIYTDWPFYGSRRITEQLRREGRVINRKTVQGQMREMGISGITPGPHLSRRAPGHRIFPYLLRGLVIERPNQVWGIDITYIRLLGGWLYLVAIIDWHSRYILSWELDETLEMPFVIPAVERALELARPEIWNSDQGSHFTSPQFTDCLQQAGVRISMDGKGRALDNILTERFWRTLKYEEVYLHDYANPKQARSGLSSYFDFYNHRRVHQSLDYLTPAEVYFQTASARQKQTTVIKSTLATKGEESTLTKALFLS